MSFFGRSPGGPAASNNYSRVPHGAPGSNAPLPTNPRYGQRAPAPRPEDLYEKRAPSPYGQRGGGGGSGG